MSANPGSPMMTGRDARWVPCDVQAVRRTDGDGAVRDASAPLRGVRGRTGVRLSDIDGKDPGSWQVMVFDDSGELVAGLRVLRPGVSFPEASLGRVVTRFRSKGYGAVAMREGTPDRVRTIWC